jgi:hypothetical protein
MEKTIEGLQVEAGKEVAKHIELQLWWNNYKMFADGDIKKLFELLDTLVLNARYVRNRDRGYGSEYYDVVVHILNMAKKPINDNLIEDNK